MLRFLFDTDHLTLYGYADVAVWRRITAQPWGAVGVSVVTAEETLRGRLAVLARRPSGPQHVQAFDGLLASLQLLQQFPLVPFDQTCESRYQQLRELRLRVGSQDLRIAATALVHRLTLLTRNRQDFARVPGLGLDDWSV
jgi:tRNA(fMet)-specific endonuclease VapC